MALFMGRLDLKGVSSAEVPGKRLKNPLFITC